MSTRTATIVLLFLSGLLAAGVTLPLSLAGVERFGGTAGAWVAPLVALVCVVGVFHAGRAFVLPMSIVRMPGRALLLITLWVGGAMAAAFATVWLLHPVFVRYDLQQGTIVIALACVLLALAPIERFVPQAPRLRGR